MHPGMPFTDSIVETPFGLSSPIALHLNTKSKVVRSVEHKKTTKHIIQVKTERKRVRLFPRLARSHALRRDQGQ